MVNNLGFRGKNRLRLIFMQKIGTREKELVKPKNKHW